MSDLPISFCRRAFSASMSMTPSRGRKRGRRKAEAPVEDEDPSTEDLFDGYDADEVGDDDDLAR